MSYEPNKKVAKNLQAQPDTEFNKGLPSSYLPQSAERFSSMNALKNDLRFRYQSLKKQMQEERKAFREGPFGEDKQKYQALINKQDQAMEEFVLNRKRLIDDYQKLLEEQESSRRKGLE